MQFIADNMHNSWNSEELEEVLKVDTFTSCIIGFLRAHIEAANLGNNDAAQIANSPTNANSNPVPTLF